MEEHQKGKTKVGEEWVNNQGCTFKIIAYHKSINCDVKFEDGTIVNKTTYQNIKKGEVKNYMFPNVYGVGFLGQGLYTKNSKSYKTWRNLLMRCYYDKYHSRQPTYKECSVDKRWHNFQHFSKWHEENYIEGFELDKDILFKGNKIYSPETCCFVPKEINTLLNSNKKSRGKYPIGVHPSGKGFKAACMVKGVLTILGTVSTIKEAFHLYKVAKESEIQRVAYKHKDKIIEPCYQALVNYKVELTD